MHVRLDVIPYSFIDAGACDAYIIVYHRWDGRASPPQSLIFLYGLSSMRRYKKTQIYSTKIIC